MPTTAITLRPPSSQPGARVYGFKRSRHVTSFFSPQHGLVAAPAVAVRSPDEAQKLNDQLAALLFMPYMKLDQNLGEPIRLMPSRSGLVFRKAEEELPLPAHQHPDMVDINEVRPQDEDLIRDIEIIDPKVRAFVNKLLASPPADPRVKIFLVHHNYTLPGSKEIRLRANTLVFKFTDGDTTYIITRRLRVDKKKFPVKQIGISALIEGEYPKRIVLCPDRIDVPDIYYEKLYHQTDTLKISDLPSEKFMDTWPFYLPTHRRFIELTRFRSTPKQTWKDYRLALKDKLFGPGAIGCVLQNSGFGLMEGALLLSILNMADATLGIITLATFLLKFTVTSFLLGNQQAGTFIRTEEAKADIRKDEDKKTPLWDIAIKYIMNKALIRMDAFTTGLNTIASLLFIHLFPPIFNLVWGAANLSAQIAVFLTAYVLADFIRTYANAIGTTVFFKLAENQVRHSTTSEELRKSFWDVHPFHVNLEIAANLAGLLIGSAVYSLLAAAMPVAFAMAGSCVGALGLLLCAARFLLPILGREEKSILVIKRDAFTRYGKMLKCSENVYLNIGDNVKVKKFDDKANKRTLILDFMTSGVKLHFRKPVRVTVKTSRLGKIFRFARRQTITIRVTGGTPKDPAVVLYNFGDKQYSEQEIRDKFLEFGEPN